MSMIVPTPYRNTLSEWKKVLYRQITEILLDYATEFEIKAEKIAPSDVFTILACIHHDHPEIFWINWWDGIRCIHYPIRRSIKVILSPLIEKKIIKACRRTMNNKLQGLSLHFPYGSSIKVKYQYIFEACIDGLAYKDTGSALYDHTIVGPLLTHSAVCEGISKLFLLYCQHFDLPCMIVCGKVDNSPHAWNLIEDNEGIKHIDITAEMAQRKLIGRLHRLSLLTSSQQCRRGYVWHDCPLIQNSR